MGKTTVKVDFGITGEIFDVDYISQKLGLTPSYFWKKGENRKLGKLQKNMEHTYWDIGIIEEVSSDIDNQLIKIYELLKDKDVILGEIKAKYKVDFTICIVIKIENSEFPVMCLKKWFIDFAHDINTEIEFDPYYYS
jgi:hypothetical protein